MLNGFAVGVSFVVGAFVSAVLLLFYAAAILKRRYPLETKQQQNEERLLIERHRTNDLLEKIAERVGK